MEIDAIERSIPELKAEFAYVLREKKNTSFEIHVIILRY